MQEVKPSKPEPHGLCPSDNLRLTAGPVSAVFDDGFLRYIRLGSAEIVRGLYSAVRDHNWDTIPGRIRDFRMERGSDSFTLRYVSEHRRGSIGFTWNAEITGAPDGTVTYSMDGTVLSTFRKNRIGFCLLHPMSLAGLPCRVTHSDGSREDESFPALISPHQPFLDMKRIEYEVLGVRVSQDFEGEVFEMEDQRNWTDASYKTYCTPLGLPFPVEVKEGERIRQRIVIRAARPDGSPARVEAPGYGAVSLRPTGAEHPLPPLGFCLAEGGEALSEPEIGRISALTPGFLRTEVRFGREGWAGRLEAAAASARAAGTFLQAALHLGSDPKSDLDAFGARASSLPLASILVFKEGEKSTSGRWIAEARARFRGAGIDIPIGSGTDAFFAELNRGRPPVADLDFLTFSINPQVHAFDDASLAETIPAQAAAVESARAFAGGRGVAVSPVTLRMRFNPNATGPEPAPKPGEPPAAADPRQKTLFGAGWTAASAASLAAAGAVSVAYYQCSGLLGLMEPGGGAVFPMYHVFADLAEFRGGTLEPLESQDPLRVSGYILRKDGRSALFLANHGGEAVDADLEGPAGTFRVRTMDGRTVREAVSDSEAFRARSGSRMAAGRFRLEPEAYVRMDRE